MLKITLFSILLLVSSASMSSRADDWALKDKDGTTFTLSSLHGKWVLVNFWAPWCPPCLQEIPDLVAIQNHHTDLQILGVAVMYRAKREVLDIVQSKAMTYPVIMGNEDIAGDFGGITGLPTSLLYNPSGKLVGRHNGPLNTFDIEQALKGNSGIFMP
jgi:thiol-disulfide isomerase/thioredoxin